MAEGSRFAYELNKVLQETSMSPEDVVARLNESDIPVPLRTFNYWLQGYFLPRSESAFQLVSVMENVLEVTGNRFSDALLHDLSSGSSFVPGESRQSELVGSGISEKMSFSSIADKAIDWEANLIQKAVRSESHVSADRKSIRQKVTVLARVPSVPNPTFFFQIHHELGDTMAADDIFYNLVGIELRKLDIFNEEDGSIIYAAQFSLPDDVVPGDLHRLSYSWDWASEHPQEKMDARLLPWTLDFYSCTVAFEGDIPENIRYVVCELVDGEEVEVPNDTPLVRDGNTVSISMKNVGNLVGYFEIFEPSE